jgi:DNA-binding transcriptional regulator YiaG
MEFRKSHKLFEKEAAAALSVPYDTWRGWECGRKTPAKFVRVALGTLMRSYGGKTVLN